jgi:glycosyltransferase involved in cell wall biosynthesis
MNLIIHAPNVHQGGGEILLKSLLRAVPRTLNATAIVDERLNLSDIEQPRPRIATIRPRVWSRLGAEQLLRNLAQPGDVVLCFGNLPPLFKTRAKVFLYLQNRYLLDADWRRLVESRSLPRIFVERVWLRAFHHHAHHIFVQTLSMQQAASVALSRNVEIMPFFDAEPASSDLLPTKGTPSFDFIYVATGEPHKNHANLIKAWMLLAAKEVFPTLCLTVDPKRYPATAALIEEARVKGKLKVENVGQIPQERLYALYRNSRALIYVSFFESFGLPLVEAANFGLPVLAPELDYVRDVVVPAHTFDPGSPTSIARAVQRFLGTAEEPVLHLSPAQFISQLFSRE